MKQNLYLQQVKYQRKEKIIKKTKSKIIIIKYKHTKSSSKSSRTTKFIQSYPSKYVPRKTYIHTKSFTPYHNFYFFQIIICVQLIKSCYWYYPHFLKLTPLSKICYFHQLCPCFFVVFFVFNHLKNSKVAFEKYITQFPRHGLDYLKPAIKPWEKMFAFAPCSENVFQQTPFLQLKGIKSFESMHFK